jgi:hypothetical protein
LPSFSSLEMLLSFLLFYLISLSTFLVPLYSSSHLVAVRKMPGLEQGCGVRLSSLVTTSHDRHRFQKGESVSCTTRFL